MKMVETIESASLSPIVKLPDCPSTYLYLHSLSLSSFRNYAHARMEVNSAPVVLTGSNGAGKTSILEAISLLTPGRGLRRAKLSGLDSINNSGMPWAVAASIEGMQGYTRIGTGREGQGGVDDADKRIVKIDGRVIRGQAELARHLSMIWLTPQMEQLFQEGTSASRKFLDRLVYGFEPEHATRVNEYEFAMRERNKLLQSDRIDSVWLDALEQTMAETGAAIASARLNTADHINEAIMRSTLSFPKADITILGVMEDALGLGTPCVQVEEDFKVLLRTNRGQDRASGRTSMGAHRSEMQVKHVTKQMPAGACSTGEQKALLLSIVLAQTRAGMRWHGVVPVILLDEVVAHLDERRRLELFEEICEIGAQTWMTGTDALLFAGLAEKAQYYQVDNGVISRNK
jgi:DNA replication and repair protein RecF